MDVDKEVNGGASDATVLAVDDPWPLERIVRIIDQIKANLTKHDESCSETVRGLALHPADHACARLHSIGPLPVLIGDQVEKGQVQLLCECNGHLMPEFDTPEDFHNFCEFGML